MFILKNHKRQIKDIMQLLLSSKRFIWRGETKQKPFLIITFDDGPEPNNTPLILEVLKEYGIKATFFIVGCKAEKYPNIVRRIVLEGHDLGNHTYSHRILPSQSLKSIKEEILKTRELIYNISGKRVDLFRPPQTRIDLKSFLMLIKMKQTIVLWSATSEDHLDIGKKHIISKINDNTVTQGDILLFHDQGKDIAAAIKIIIDNLRKGGYKFCTISDAIFSCKAKH